MVHKTPKQRPHFPRYVSHSFTYHSSIRFIPTNKQSFALPLCPYLPTYHIPSCCTPVTINNAGMPPSLPLDQLLSSTDHADFSARRQLSDISIAIAKARRIVTVSGAGISCSSGIPVNPTLFFFPCSSCLVGKRPPTPPVGALLADDFLLVWFNLYRISALKADCTRS